MDEKTGAKVLSEMKHIDEKLDTEVLSEKRRVERKLEERKSGISVIFKHYADVDGKIIKYRESDNVFYFPLASGSFGKIFMFYSPNKKELYISKIILSDRDNLRKHMRELSYMYLLYDFCNKYIICWNKIYRINNMEEKQMSIEYMMEFSGFSLESYLKKNRNKLINLDILLMMRKLLYGLDLIHSKGFVHRDIKTLNIVFDPTEFLIKYIDFGTACLDPRKLSNYTFETDYKDLKLDVKDMVTCLKTNVFTPSYMSPELTRNEVDTWEEWVKCDIWALGVTFYRMLLRRNPYKGKNGFLSLVNNINIKPEVNLYEFKNKRLRSPITRNLFAPLINGMLKKDVNERVTVKMAIRLVEDALITELKRVVKDPTFDMERALTPEMIDRVEYTRMPFIYASPLTKLFPSRISKESQTVVIERPPTPRTPPTSKTFFVSRKRVNI